MSTYPNAKILFVDDEQNVLAAMERAFSDEGYQIFTVNSGEKGLSVIEKQGPFQVIVSDYRMPYMNGDEFLQKVYARWPETECIVLSGYVDIAAIVASINKGHIYKFIPKPWNDDDLRTTIRHCLDRYYSHKKDRELMAELELSQEILTHLPLGVVAIDSHNQVIFCNETAAALLPLPLPLGGVRNNSSMADSALQALATQGRSSSAPAVEAVLGGRNILLRGESVVLNGQKVVILVLLER